MARGADAVSPARIAVACAQPRCPNAAIRDGRCALHVRPARPTTVRYDRARGTSVQRGYGYGWQQLRAEVLALRPWCQEVGCPRPATDVHHIIARRRGGSDDPANLVSLCASCHSRVTIRFDGGFGNARGRAR